MFKKIFLVITVFFTFQNTIYAIDVNSEGAVLIEADTGQIIYKKNENKKLPIASTTKIMTAILAIENAEPNDEFVVSKKAQNQEGSSIYLRENEKITVNDLLYGLSLNSGNDAAVVLAEGVGGTEENFVKMMNEKAKKIGCKNTHFTNPNGLYDKNHQSTALDMAKIMAYAMNNGYFRKIVSTKNYQIDNGSSITYLKNHNKLLWKYDYCIGGKTGFTKLSGRCLVSCCEKDNIRLVSVTLNCPDDWKTNMDLFDYGFQKVKISNVIEKNEILTTRKINGVNVNLIAENEVSIPLLNDRKRNISAKVFINKNKDIKSGTVIGYADIYYKKRKVARTRLLSGQDVKYSYYRAFKGLIKRTPRPL